MASPDIDSPWLCAANESFGGCFNMQIEEIKSANVLNVLEAPSSSMSDTCNIPKPPPYPNKLSKEANNCKRILGTCSVPHEIKDTWDRLFKEVYGADVYIITDRKSYVPAHCNVLSISSPVLGNILQQSKVKDGIRYIKILGVPCEAVYMFIRFLYSSCYEEDEMKKFVLHLMVLSHAYSVPSLKRICIDFLEQDYLTRENVIDVLQLARSCNAPRLSFICVRMVVKDLKTISSTEGWKVMKRANPALEQELVESVVEADSRKQERMRKIEERKVYLQLYEAMEALLHICRTGVGQLALVTKCLKEAKLPATFLLARVSNSGSPGCVHCKRMWQLLELHSRMCNDPDYCKVPLCRHFKEKVQHQTKKDEAKWKLLVSKVIAAKNALGHSQLDL
ncbi:BTB/POZ and TAZ domain-containing protein [Salix suchowensis]|nr:BTB/POZ and TAZ domain-containing protein [Salix suchowensis]